MIPLKLNFYCRMVPFFFLAIVVLSCNKEKEERKLEQHNIPTYPFEKLSLVYPEILIATIEVINYEASMVPYYLEFSPKRKFLIVSDRTGNAIHLFDQTGRYIGKSGREGRGPGEFTGSIRLHIGWDNHLYTYDSRLRRVTRFEFEQDGLTYLDSYLASQQASFSLQNIYITEWGNFGVFQFKIDFTTGKEEFQLVKLDEEFNQVERLISIPGNEKMPLDNGAKFTQYIDHIVGQKTLWDVDGEWFYYISSHSSVINKYNLKTGESITEVYFKLEERVINEEVETQLIEYSSSITSRFPSVKNAINEVQVLPLFQELVVYNDQLYLTVFDITGNELTEMIRINEQTKEVHYLKIPGNISRIQVGNNKLYGIGIDEGDFSSIIIIHLTD